MSYQKFALESKKYIFHTPVLAGVIVILEDILTIYFLEYSKQNVKMSEYLLVDHDWEYKSLNL